MVFPRGYQGLSEGFVADFPFLPRRRFRRFGVGQAFDRRSFSALMIFLLFASHFDSIARSSASVSASYPKWLRCQVSSHNSAENCLWSSQKPIDLAPPSWSSETPSWDLFMIKPEVYWFWHCHHEVQKPCNKTCLKSEVSWFWYRHHEIQKFCKETCLWSTQKSLDFGTTIMKFRISVKRLVYDQARSLLILAPPSWSSWSLSAKRSISRLAP